MTKDVPTSAQIKLAQAIAYQTGKRLPRGYTAHQNTCGQFIEENKKYLRPSEAQVLFALGLARVLHLKMERSDFLSYVFCKRFLNLFAGKDDDIFHGYRRARVIEEYLREDKDFEHVYAKFELSRDDIGFIREIITTYKHKDSIIRWDDQAPRDERFLELIEDSNMLSENVSQNDLLTLTPEMLDSLTETEKMTLLVPGEGLLFD